MKFTNGHFVTWIMTIPLLFFLGSCEKPEAPTPPDEAQQKTRRTQQQSTSTVNKAWQAYRNDNYEKTLELLKEYRDGPVDNPTIPNLLARAHYELNEFSKSNEQWNRAIPLIRDKAQLDYARQFEERTKQLTELELDRFQYNHFTIMLPSTMSKRIANEINHQLERAYQGIGGDLSYFPDERFTVIIYRPGQYRRTINAPIWSGGLFDGKIHVKYNESESPSYSPRVLVHEYSHAVVYSLARDNVPKWFNEGFATYQEHRQTNRDFRYLKLEESPPQQTIRNLSDISRMFNSGSGEDSNVRLGYEYSYSMIEFMKHQHGLEQIKRLLKKTGETSSFSDALLKVLNTNEQNLQLAWERWLNNRVR